jgi:Cu/Ag efflux pump CusA
MATVPVYFRLGSEFMPPLNEGTILYMPTTLPGLSVTEAAKLLQIQDKILMSVPEVERVFGKAGRAGTSTDPAPFSMMETTAVLKDKEFWRPGLTWDRLIAELDTKMQIPGVTNAWTMPIRARIDMLTTGVRTPVGIKVFGPQLAEIEKIGAVGANPPAGGRARFQRVSAAAGIHPQARATGPPVDVDRPRWSSCRPSGANITGDQGRALRRNVRCQPW